jgi:hypothetical protein
MFLIAGLAGFVPLLLAQLRWSQRYFRRHRDDLAVLDAGQPAVAGLISGLRFPGQLAGTGRPAAARAPGPATVLSMPAHS